MKIHPSISSLRRGAQESGETTGGVKLYTERINEDHRTPAGRIVRHVSYIAYSEYIMAYDRIEDRISRAWGTGRTKKEALAEAQQLGNKHGKQNSELDER